jgi:hypothetical protein
MHKGQTSPSDLLENWVVKRCPPPASKWFAEQLELLRSNPSEKSLYLALGYATRKLGKDDLKLNADDLATANKARTGWDPSDWSVDQAARLAFILASYNADAVRFRDRLEQLFRTADVGELITFYRGLPLYPEPQLHIARAREGARSGMQPIFEAVAHRNPYPAEQFDENSWNHMVLKALFIGSTLAPIQGLDRRANPSLMRMLCDYAHERWAAGRPVAPELWRCVGPHADAAALDDLARVLKTGDAQERNAAALALHAAASPAAKRLLETVPALAAEIKSGQLTWAKLAAA